MNGKHYPSLQEVLAGRNALLTELEKRTPGRRERREMQRTFARGTRRIIDAYKHGRYPPGLMRVQVTFPGDHIA